MQRRNPTFIDLTLAVSPAHGMDTQRYSFLDAGHLGTHFDVMNKEFPLDFIRREGIVFDVSRIRGRDIDIADIDMAQVAPDMFVALHTGFIREHAYGTRPYFDEHPQLSVPLIDALLDRCVSIIGLDCAGLRRGKEHTPMDQVCADRGAFVVENLENLDRILGGAAQARFTAHTYPVKFTGMTGLPCRVVAEV